MKSMYVVAVGKPLPSAIEGLVSNYKKRCEQWCDIVQIFVQPSKQKDVDKIIADESLRLLKVIPNNALVILLDEKGKQYDSISLSKAVTSWREGARSVYFVIGGAYGVDDSFCKRADEIWSFSKQVFPHKLMQVLLVEQLYRSMAISKNLPYHHS